MLPRRALPVGDTRTHGLLLADWLVNGVLFALYHLHLPWSIPANALDTFIISYPVSRYRSALIGICVHSVQTVVFTALLLGLVLR